MLFRSDITRVLMHEAIHAATARQLWEMGEFAGTHSEMIAKYGIAATKAFDEIDAMREKYGKELINSLNYNRDTGILTDNAEFMSYMLSEPAAFDKFSKINTGRSEEHTSELQSHYSISYAVFCLKSMVDRKSVV